VARRRVDAEEFVVLGVALCGSDGGGGGVVVVVVQGQVGVAEQKAVTHDSKPNREVPIAELYPGKGRSK
jgi:hypothetical protein